jgi:hypothetical protein
LQAGAKRHQKEKQMSNIRLGDVRYNAQARAFEARVDVISGGAVMATPVRCLAR